jgi:hypothetical protein
VTDEIDEGDRDEEEDEGGEVDEEVPARLLWVSPWPVFLGFGKSSARVVVGDWRLAPRDMAAGESAAFRRRESVRAVCSAPLIALSAEA